MAQSTEESLLQAIKTDDIKAFDALMKSARCGKYRLGRFPVLSLLYLYKSSRILSEYEEEFLKITDYEELREPVEVFKKFSEKAGKCLRLYHNEIVSPLEMLLISDRTKHLKEAFPKVKPSVIIKERLRLIYSIKYSLTIRYDGDAIILDRRPLSYRTKRNIAAACLASVLVVTLSVGVPLTVSALMPKPVEGEVTKLDQIDFGSQKEYTLKNNIVVPENYRVEKMSCTIVGDGNKLILGSGASLGEFSGKISGVTIESAGNAIFTTVRENAKLENVTVNVKSDIASTEGTAFIAMTNYGTLDGVTVNVKGNLCALAASSETSSDVIFGGIVQTNDSKFNVVSQTGYTGVIKNCTVNYSQFTITGVTTANASFGGVAGINNGYLQDCTVTGEISADTFDIAGLCSTNNGLISGSVNEADLSQTSADINWNPIASGIVMSNAYAIENCENRGKITSVSICGQFEVDDEYETAASASGIAYLNRSSTSAPYIVNCKNWGDIECSAEYRTVYAAGICISSSGPIDSSENSGAVTAKSNHGCDAYGGGVTALSYGDISKCVNYGAISITGDGTACAGGITARSWSRCVYCLSGGDVTVKAKEVYAGGISGVSEIMNYGYYIYCGTVDYSISDSKISVTATDGKSYVGGITGCVCEVALNGIESVIYYGGGVTNSYFTGKCASETEYFGSIVGVCAVNIYASNSYTSNNIEYRNFDGNYYIDRSYNALGATVAEDGEFVTAEDMDKGATVATAEEIKSLNGYKLILSALDILTPDTTDNPTENY